MKTFRAAAAAIALALFAASPAAAAEKVTLAYLPSLHGLPLFVAIEEKLFQKAGIEVEAVKFENPNQIIDSLVSGRADAAPAGGAAGITALAETRFPGALKVFGLQGSNTARGAVNDQLIVKPDSPIASFKDLKGKKLAHAPGIQWRTIAQTVVKANGLEPGKDVELVEMAIGLQAQAVVSGTVDAALALEPVGSIASGTGVVKVAVKNAAGTFIVDPFYAGVGVASARFLKERPEVARKMIAVMDEAVALIEKDFDAYAKHLVGYTAVTDATIKFVKPMYFVGSAGIDAKAIADYQKFADIFLAAGAMKTPVDVATIIIKPGQLN